MMPSVNSSFHMVSVFTIPGLDHLAVPLDASVHRPGWTELAIDCRVSWSKPSCEAPWTKQPWEWALNTVQTCTHWASVVGGVRSYFSNRPSLTHSVPA